MGEVALPTPHPHPLPRTIPLEAVDLHRDLWCDHYEDCLDQAVRREWISWSCSGCPLKGQAQIKPELRVGGDSALVEAIEMGHPRSVGRALRSRIHARPPSDIVYARLDREPQPIADLAGIYSVARTRDALLRFAKLGIAEEVEPGRWRATGTRTCTGCRQTKTATAFPGAASGADGRAPRCRTCREAWAEANKQKQRARGRGRR